MSDYVDENFELDETDEHYGVNHHDAANKVMSPHFNDLDDIYNKSLFIIQQ